MTTPHHDCKFTPVAPRLDGDASGPGWDSIPWVCDFLGDIASGPRPTLRTDVKMLWDAAHFYVALRIEEPHVWATVTERNAVVFMDNDVEVFVDCDGTGRNYYECEVNALGTLWELMLNKSYKEGGHATDWNLSGLRCGVSVDGTLNDPRDVDVGWNVTLAFPVTEMKPFGAAPLLKAGMEWRVNYSRVQWQHEVVGGKYVRVPPHGTPLPQGSNKWHPEKNWTWANMGEVNAHIPERWGFVRFVE